MKNNNTPENTSAAPAKKQWQKPDFYIIDQDNVNGGPVDAQQELTTLGGNFPGPGAGTGGHQVS